MVVVIKQPPVYREQHGLFIEPLINTIGFRLWLACQIVFTGSVSVTDAS